MNRAGRPRAPHLIAAGLLLLGVQAILPPGNLSQAALFLLLWIFPALLWMQWLPGMTLERFCGGAGLALLAPVLLTLLSSYIPGPLPRWSLALVVLCALFLPYLAVILRPPLQTAATEDQPEERPWSRRQLLFLLFILLLAAYLRLANLDYKEFQGDEGVIMMRAAQALLGDEMALLRHQKGPVEILLPLLPWGLGGSIDERWSRVAFTWAGLLVVPALAVLGRRWYGTSSGLLAALLFALGGFSIAFARIVQYQSLVMLWGVLSLIYAHRYFRQENFINLILAAVFLAGGLLAHYDAILVAPAVGWLVIARWRQSHRRQWSAHAAAAAIVGGALLAFFYIPYLANPTIGATGSYLLQDRLGGSLLSWSIPHVWRMATFYNSTYYVILLLILTLLGIVSAKRHQVAAILFLVVPLVFYTFVVADPRTHIYTIFPGLSIVAGVGAVWFWRRAQTRLLQRVGLALFSLLLAASLLYVYLLFVDVTPERQRTWARNRPAYFPTTWSEPPEFGLFGFPHQAGWRLAHTLVGELPYASNEEPQVTSWYMAQAPRTHCPDFRTFVLASNAQDALPYDAGRVQERNLEAVVSVNGAPSLHVYGDAVSAVAAVEATGHGLWRTPGQIVPPLHTGDVAVGMNFGQKIRLLGYTLESQTIGSGQTVNVVLYWQALAPIDRNYQVFVHLYDGTMWAQHDGAPDCDLQPTSGWEPGQIVRDAHQLQLSPDTPSAEIPLLVGMYDLLSDERLPVARTGADAIQLTDLTTTGARP